MTKNKKPKYSFTQFFFNYFDNLGEMTLINLIMCIPIAVFTGLMVLTAYLTGQINIFVLFLGIPVTAPFFAGALYVGLKLTRGEVIRPIQDFFKGMKDNYKAFLLNSVIVYIISAGLYLTFSFYRGGLRETAVMAAFVLSFLFALFFIFFEFGLVTMLVSVDIGFGAAVKNAVVLVAGGLVEHLKAIVVFLLTASVIYSAVLLSGNMVVGIIICAAAVLLFLPVLSAYIIVYNVFRVVERIVIAPFEQQKIQSRQAKEEIYKPDMDEMIALAKGDPEEYVFLGGRMLKRKAVIKMIENRKQ
ncbi:MAG: hypothetical protein IJ861_10000 [Clostridia bacterium]|nr:hypothetical protein [Clostridia bacterium]